MTIVKYADVLANVGAGPAVLPASHRVSGNSIWDPDDTNIGHTFYGAPWISQQYNRYFVYKSQILWTITNFQTDDFQPIIVVAASHKNANFLLDLMNTALNKQSVPWERNDVITREVQSYASVANRFEKRIKVTSTTKKHFGPTTDLMDSDATAPMNADPANQWWHLLYWYKRNANTSGNFTVGFKIKYWVMFYDPKSAGAGEKEDVEAPETPDPGAPPTP